MKEFIEKYSFPTEHNVHVVTKYMGKRIDKKFLDDHPEISILYPNQNEFTEKYIELKNETLQNKFSILEINENGIVKHLNMNNLDELSEI
jgi:hypothetical protein